jgi:hypothetical protein
VVCEKLQLRCEIQGSHGGDYEDNYLLGCDAMHLLREDVSEERSASIFRVEHRAACPSKTSAKIHDVTCQKTDIFTARMANNLTQNI